MTRRPAALLSLLLLLPACSGGDDPTVADPATNAPAAPPAASAPAEEPAAPTAPADGAVVLRGDGLTLGGTAFAFGQANRTEVEAALTSVLGEVQSSGIPCPAGQRSALGANGFDVLFDGDTMVGWDDAAGAGATESGLRLGSTRADVEAALPDAEFSESTLGPEFLSPDGLAGFLDGTQPTSVVLGLTGGEQCVQR